MKVLGIAGSLRNARFGTGSDLLAEEISRIKNFEELAEFLKLQTKLRSDDFVAAGRSEKLPFDVMYRNLQKNKKSRGLSNSEAALAAGLWGAYQQGADVSHLGLARYFPMSGPPQHLPELKAKIIDSDALLLAGPVYFGDRGSLIQSFIEFITSDEDLKEHLSNRVYSGISVGAKRNGGQETSLIYQIVDMANLGMLAVGNGADTTSQYGGTVVAGDVGTAWSDDYGLKTSVSAGERLAKIAMSLENANKYTIKDKVKVGIWLVQDTADGHGAKIINNLISKIDDDDIEFVLDCITEDEVLRCIACDLCPIFHAPRDEYACIIKSKDDYFVKNHKKLSEFDAVLMAAYSPVDRSKVKSIYQQFIERTRYLRRANYMLRDRLASAFVISEINSNQNLHIRMLTSLIRHQTILHHPVILTEKDGEIINEDFGLQNLKQFVATAKKATIAGIAEMGDQMDHLYNPVGYEISAERNRQDLETGVIGSAVAQDSEVDALSKNSRLIQRK